MLRKIIVAPHPTLNKKALEVAEVTDTIRQTLDDMLETMYKGHGCGLAANQVNIAQRFFVMDCSKEQNKPVKLINPVITWKSDEKGKIEEGCLSLPGARVEVERAKTVRVKFLDENGKEQEKEFDNIEAVCVQHEIDHLDGITLLDYVSPPQRRKILAKIPQLV